MATTYTNPETTDDGTRVHAPARRGHIGWVVAGSLTSGLLAALLLAAAPFVPPQEAAMTGAVLCGFALGWAMLAVLSVRTTDQPQSWAAVPAVVMGLGGFLLLVLGSSVDPVLGWVWPPVVLTLVVWMVVQARRRLRSRSRRWLLYPVIAMLAVAALGGMYETLGVSTDPSTATSGRSIDIGGRSLHLECTGTGSPTVLLQPGGGAMSAHMAWIAPRVAASTRVCVYDRPGRGGSDPVETAQDATQIAVDLHALLEQANVPGPYVLAGHSFGGLYALTYAARYPDQIAGLVIVDTTAPRDEPLSGGPDRPKRYDLVDRVATLISTSARLGVTRLYATTEGAGLPPRSASDVRATTATGSNFRSFIDEFAQANSSMAEAASFTDFGARPLIVLTAGTGTDAALTASHERIARMSSNSTHRTIADATHDDLIADQHDSTATSQAILDVITAIRNATTVPE
ncbi:alpha/beta hydrolase [Cellulomonas sp.]|uniref:alpha/beta hydrolase n=1 Tax=Cellulomonas sp. TaxID=40001 RepID=UPI003BABDE04